MRFSIGFEEVNCIFLIFIFTMQKNTGEDDFIFEIRLIDINMIESYFDIRLLFLDSRYQNSESMGYNETGIHQGEIHTIVTQFLTRFHILLESLSVLDLLIFSMM